MVIRNEGKTIHNHTNCMNKPTVNQSLTCEPIGYAPFALAKMSNKNNRISPKCDSLGGTKNVGKILHEGKIIQAFLK